MPGCRLYCRAKIQTGMYTLAGYPPYPYGHHCHMIASCMQSECKWRSYKVATIRLCMDGSFLNCSIVQNGSPVEVSDDHALLSSCAVAKQGCAACNVGIGESTAGKGEKQTARNGRNGEVFPVFIWRAFILTVDKG